MEIKKYRLEKDSSVTVYKIFGNKIYLAVVEINGRYPKAGYEAYDVGRHEYLLVVSGQIRLKKNGKVVTLKEGKACLIKPREPYVIRGEGKVTVLVRDGRRGMTRILAEAK